MIICWLKQVSHHPTLIACHCEGRGWKFWGDSNIRAKFWGRSIQLDPVGVLTLEFDDGEIFQWSKVCVAAWSCLCKISSVQLSWSWINYDRPLPNQDWLGVTCFYILWSAFLLIQTIQLVPRKTKVEILHSLHILLEKDD